jgi:hypothetical protein
MNIRVITNNRPESEMLFKERGTVVNPAVLELTDSKRALIKRSPNPIPVSAWPLESDSVSINPKVPIRMRRPEVRSTRRVCRLR